MRLRFAVAFLWLSITAPSQSLDVLETQWWSSLGQVETVNKGCVFYASFERPTASDLGGVSYVLSTTPNRTNGITGKGYQSTSGNVSGTTDQPAALDFTGDMTLAVWVRLDTLGASAMKVFQRYKETSPYTGWSMEFRPQAGASPTNAIGFYTSAIGFVYSTGGVSASAWTHLAVTGTGTSGVFYINGDPSGIFGYVAHSTYTSDAYLGNRNGGIGDFLLGSIDEVRAYNRGLSPHEVRQLYNAGRILGANQ